MHGLEERASTPPYILGTFPKLELMFECVDKPDSAQPSSSSAKYERIEKLKRLFDSGALTQEEFSREKAKVLAEP
jgi:hypothetical protein